MPPDKLDRTNAPTYHSRGFDAYWAPPASTAAQDHTDAQSSLSGNSSPRVGRGSISTALSTSSSLTSYGSAAQDDSPVSPYSYSHSGAMNATQTYVPQSHAHHGYMDQSHMSSHPHAPTSAPPHYYAPGPMMPPTPMSYAPYPHHYPAYGHPVTSAPHHGSAPAPYHHQPMHHQGMAIPPTMGSSQPPSAGPAVNEYSPNRMMDSTGQVPPPGIKPKLTGTVWEDEGTLCFQVEVRGICVARREDNCFINGTKLLNVANMTRGRRDGILKSEKTRNVIKIGPMHLKGVWIPFERALEFANKEKITEQLYPLFVHNISPMLAPHFNTQARRGESQQNPPGSAGGPPPSVSTPQPQAIHGTPTTSQAPAASTSMATPQSLPPASRPGIDRAHTFPTPPTSATSTAGQTGLTYGWEPNGLQTSHSLPIDNSIHGGRSMPATPTTTSPDGMPPMHYSAGQSYESKSSAMYATPHQTPHYGHSSSYGSMQPPPKREEEHDPHSRDYGQAYAGSAEYGYGDHSDVKSGQLTPKATPQSTWTSGYGSNHRNVPSSNLAYVIGEGSYGSSYVNGSSNKRVREVDDDEADAIDAASMKKRKTDDLSFAQPRSTLVRQ